MHWRPFHGSRVMFASEWERHIKCKPFSRLLLLRLIVLLTTNLSRMYVYIAWQQRHQQKRGNMQIFFSWIGYWGLRKGQGEKNWKILFYSNFVCVCNTFFLQSLLGWWSRDENILKSFQNFHKFLSFAKVFTPIFFISRFKSTNFASGIELSMDIKSRIGFIILSCMR